MNKGLSKKLISPHGMCAVVCKYYMSARAEKHDIFSQRAETGNRGYF